MKAFNPFDFVIAVLEDDPIMMAIIKDALQEQGYTVCPAFSITELQRLLNPGIDLILSDIHLPDGNGLEFCLNLKHKKQINCPIIAITSNEKQDAIDAVFQSGADDYIQKPFVLQELTARVALHIKSHSMNQSLAAVLEDQPAGILIVDEYGSLVFSNSKAKEWLNSPLNVQENWMDSLAISSRDKLKIKSLLADDSAQRDSCFTQYKVDSEVRYIEWSVKANHLIKHGRIIYLSNHTEIKNLKENLQLSSQIIGTSSAVVSLIESIKQLSQVDWSVLIEGETGTGKELVARSLHEHSDRSSAPFIAINCAGLTETLLTDQLFGHEKGAFTGAENAQKGFFEQAEHGTLFLDEIGDLPLIMQGTLLRVLQEKSITRLGGNQTVNIDVRLIFATHQNLEAMVNNGQFRRDLYYRINSASIQVPPLRQRQQDIAPLMQYWLIQDCQKNSLHKPLLEESAIQWFKQQLWPGNIRQLQQVVRRILLADQTRVDEALARQVYGHQDKPLKQDSSSASLAETALNSEIEHILKAISTAQGNKDAAAKMLGISRATLYRKLQKYQQSHI